MSGRDFPTNRGGLCRKGWTSASLLNHTGRVTEPLLKGADGVHRPIGWDEALELITAAVKDHPRPVRRGRRRSLRRRRTHQ